MKSPPGPWARRFPLFFQCFYNVLRRVAPFKSLLQFFEFECQFQTKFRLFGNVFNALGNNLRWLKSPPDPWARDFPPFLQRFAAFAPFKSLLQFFSFVCQLETKPTLFGNVFTVLRNNLRWLKSPPGPWARDFPPILERCAASHPSNLCCNFLSSSVNSKLSWPYLGMSLLR